jgi:SMC interacting uncharacterized protein involved in chromosome segregation
MQARKMTLFDTAAALDTLRDHDFADRQAKGIVDAMKRALSESVVTNSELQETKSDLKGEIRDVEAGLKGEIRDVEAGLKGKIRDVESVLRGELREVEAGLRGEIREVENRLDRKIDLMVNKLTGRMVSALCAIAVMFTIFGFVLKLT